MPASSAKPLPHSFPSTAPALRTSLRKPESWGGFLCLPQRGADRISPLFLRSQLPRTNTFLYVISTFEVSVSAMPPCTQSFIPLPLPHEYNLNDMIASKRYESVWNTFLKELTRDSAVTLSSLQKKWHVNRSGMKQWMRNNGLSVKEAKKHIHECRHYAEEGQMLPLPATAGNLFLPMTTDQPALQPESCDILSGVSLVFPDGTQVNIRRGSAQAVMSFLKLYQREDLPCLD